MFDYAYDIFVVYRKDLLAGTGYICIHSDDGPRAPRLRMQRYAPHKRDKSETKGVDFRSGHSVPLLATCNRKQCRYIFYSDNKFQINNWLKWFSKIFLGKFSLHH